MDESIDQILITKAKSFFRKEIVTRHIEHACKKAAHLSEYNVNPFLFKYLANFLKGNDQPRSIAEALIYPRLLGSSITTSFGMNIQKMISELFEGFASTTSGIDIEYIDKLDGRKKYCQLKAGPNTINHDDVQTILDHFQSVRRLARTNNLTIGLNDLVVGVIYGDQNDLSGHYLRIAELHPVHIGQDFWHRLTGNPQFYFQLIEAIGEVALEVDGRQKLEEAIQLLSQEIEAKFSS